MRVIATTPLRAGQELRVLTNTYKGHALVHCRRYYLEGDEWKPGKGLAVPPDLLPWLCAAVEQALVECVNAGDTLLEDFTNAGLTPPVGLFEEAA